MITNILYRQENYVKAFSKQVKRVTGVRTHTLRGVRGMDFRRFYLVGSKGKLGKINEGVGRSIPPRSFFDLTLRSYMGGGARKQILSPVPSQLL